MSDVSKTNALRAAIAYLKPIAESATVGGYGEALKAVMGAAERGIATRVPVQGEPNDDREALKRIAEVASEQRLKDSIAEYKDATSDEMEPTDWELEFWHAGYKHGANAMIEHQLSCAAVPDAALEAAARAAAGTAPQAESEHFHIWSTQPCKPGQCRMEPAPVLPSSTTPQAEAYDHCCQHPKCPGGSLCCCASEQRLRDCWNQWLEEIAGDSKQAFRDGYQAGQNDPAPWLTAPVLPSSGVDEDAAIQLVQDLAREAYEAYEDSSDDAYGAWSWLTERHEQMRAGRGLAGKEKNDEKL